MINWETIKSLYNDKPTLLQWLKKVEAALSDATLTSVSVNTISVGVITLTFNFADGTSITTPEIDLPQGAQGVSIVSAAIVNGHLNLTLSNGQVLDAGEIFNGNVNIMGDLSVVGSIINTLLNNTENMLNGASYVENFYQNEGDITIFNLPDGYRAGYAHWRISNGKLNIVFSLYVDANTPASSSQQVETIADIIIPSSIGSKIYNITGETTGTIGNAKLELLNIYSPANKIETYVRFYKESNTTLHIMFVAPNSYVAYSGVREGRVEFNVTL